MQTEGSKRWRLYRPTPSSAAATPAGAQLAHCQLANRVSGDLREADIGEPLMEVVLKVRPGGCWLVLGWCAVLCCALLGAGDLHEVISGAGSVLHASV